VQETLKGKAVLPYVLAVSSHAMGLQHFYTFQQGEVEERIVSALTQDFLAYLNITNFLTSDTHCGTHHSASHMSSFFF